MAREEFAASLDIIGSSLRDGSLSFDTWCPSFGEGSLSFDTGCPFFANFTASFGIFAASLDILASS
jgi:hypothetical protein